MRHVTCPNCQCQCPVEGRRFRPVRMLLQIVLLYVVLVFGGGTLQNVSHPVAVEAGRLMQIVTFVEPTIRWADAHGHPGVSGGLRLLADGVSLS